jgi:hypothetical protein
MLRHETEDDHNFRMEARSWLARNLVHLCRIARAAGALVTRMIEGDVIAFFGA